MYPATKKTRVINAFKREQVNNARDLYAKYGPRFNTKGLRGTDSATIGTIVPESQAVISQMIAGQIALKSHLPDDLSE